MKEGPVGIVILRTPSYYQVPYIYVRILILSTNKMSPSDQQSWIGYALKITQHRLRLSLEAELQGTGISPSQNAVLLAVAGNPRISNASLARTAFVTPQSMQGMLVTLERDGFIIRRPHPEHGRIIMTELTDRGRAAAVKGTIAAEAVERRMLFGFTTEETRLLRELLNRCAEALEVDR